MNSGFMRWFLDIDIIPEDATGLEFVFERALPGWVWVLLVLGTGALAFWSYSRLIGSRKGRGLLAATRWALLLLALIILSGPMLRLPRESVEEDWIVVLLDRSASLTIKDTDDERTGARISRDEQVSALIDENRDVWTAIDADRELVWLGFHTGAFGLATEDPSGTTEADGADSTRAALPIPGDAEGQRTRLNRALLQALQRAAARPLSGIVVVSDGRTDDPPTRSTLRQLQAEQIPVYPVALGSSEPIGDLAVRRIDAPRRAFVRDKVPVVVELDRLGTAQHEAGVSIRLIDDVTGEELDSTELSAAELRDDGSAMSEVTLTATPELAGETTWRVVIDSDSPDLIPENDTRPFSIDLVDRPLRVLYVEGYPRWEYHYIKSLLIREESIESSVMLISADRDFAQEGNTPISRLPRSPEEFAAFDVIILGDVPGTFFSPDQLDMIRDQVADRGSGLLWVGGERYTPATYTGSVLADLLPMRGALELPPIEDAINMAPTPLAERLGVMRLATSADVGWPVDLVDPSFGWSQLYWAQRIEPGRLKPAAEVIAETIQEFNGEALPLVINMRFGAGQTIYVGTDETWRWRYGRGETLMEQFWVQMIRMLGRESLSSGDEPVVVRANPRRVALNEPVRVDARLVDPRLIDESRGTLRLEVQTVDGTVLEEIQLQSMDDSGDQYVTTWMPGQTGTIRLRLDDPSLELVGGPIDAQATVEVFAPDDELRRPETDHGLLEQLAADTGGRVFNVNEVDQLLEPGVLRNRSVRTPNPLNERIWDTPLVFTLVLLLLTLEWVGRKLIRLV